MEIKKVAMIGAGVMGNQIAMQCAIHGYEVVCFSRRKETVEKAAASAAGWFEKRVEKEKMTREDADHIRARLKFTENMKEAVTDADLIIEAVADVVETKKAVLKQVDAYAPEHAIYASNSSYIVSSEFCDAVRHPERVLNLHFFNPVLVMKLVEVVKSPHCDAEIVESMVHFVESIGKVPAIVNKEIYGFIVNRIYSAITKEACYMLDQGVSSVEDIDKAVKFGLSHPMGPFELLDMTGIDLEYDVLTERYRKTGNLADKPSPSLVEHYAKGEFGRKTGKGYYSYEKK